MEECVKEISCSHWKESWARPRATLNITKRFFMQVVSIPPKYFLLLKTQFIGTSHYILDRTSWYL
jgi:hypothetical protein